MVKKRIRFMFFVTLMAVVTIPGCSRFKVEKLGGSLIAGIPIGEGDDQLNLPSQRGVVYEVTANPGITRKMIAISEPSRKKIKIFRQNELSVIIQSETVPEAVLISSIDKKPAKGISVVRSKFLDIPGNIAAGREDDFYVVSYTSMPGSVGVGGNEGYYKILHFDMKGKFLHILGRQGQTELPFENIIWMDTDEDNNFWVLHRYLGELFLEKYQEGILTTKFSGKECENHLFSGKIGNPSEYLSCEAMYPFDNGEDILFVGRAEKTPAAGSEHYDFLYRTLAVYNTGSREKTYVFDKMNDPEAFPYMPYEDTIFFWKTVDPKRVKLSIYDTDGTLVNNYQVDFFGRKQNWRSLFATLSGNIYSVRIYEKALEIYQWK